MKRTYEKTLLELTALPTATGREDAVVRYIERWAKPRRSVTLKRDEHGNLMLSRRGARSRQPIVLEAHMDHPAFVVVSAKGCDVEAEFRGGVKASFFKGSYVRHWQDGKRGAAGVVSTYKAPGADTWAGRAKIRFDSDPQAIPGDIVTWDLPDPKARGDRFVAPVCDDLAGVAAGLSAFSELVKKPGPDVRLLLTRAEEVGFIGAMAATRSGLIPQAARLICLETSKASSEAPIGDGPIVRVGDRASTFTPELTYGVGLVAQQLSGGDASFVWQRRLMTGGVCEASAFQALGYRATCVCLALGNYHNMNDEAGRIDSEFISLSDYHGLVRLLVAVGRGLDEAEPLRRRLDRLYRQRRRVLR